MFVAFLQTFSQENYLSELKNNIASQVDHSWITTHESRITMRGPFHAFSMFCKNLMVELWVIFD